MRPFVKHPLLHVDLVKNEWSAGVQLRVASVEAVDRDRVQVSHASQEYRDLLSAPITNPDRTGDVMYLEKEAPEVAFSLLPRLYSSSYFFVTVAHSEEDCLFRESDVLPMTVVSPEAWDVAAEG